jgi:membrane protease YdiL (CAAX protease family)
MISSQNNSSINQFIKKNQIILFYLIALGITWIGWYLINLMLLAASTLGSSVEELIFEEKRYDLLLFSIIGNFSVFGPAIAAFIVTCLVDGKTGVRSLFNKIIRWRVSIIWIVIALGLPLVVKYGSFLFNAVFLGGSLEFDMDRFLTFVFVFIENLILSGGQEEIGWTGFVQLRLQTQYSVFQATVIKIFMGWIWHLPLYLLFTWASQFGQNILLFLWYYIPIGFIYTWLFNNTDSVLLPALLHASFNTVGIHAITLFSSNETVILTIIIMGLIMYIIVFLIFLKDGLNLTHKKLPEIVETKMKKFNG